MSHRQIHQAARQWRGEQTPRSFWSRRSVTAPIAAVGLLCSAALVAAYVENWPVTMTEQALTAALDGTVLSERVAQPEQVPPAGASIANQTTASAQSVPAVSTQTETAPPPQATWPSTTLPMEQQSPPTHLESAQSALAPASQDNMASAETAAQANTTVTVSTPKANKPSKLPRGVKVIGPGSPPQAVRWLRHELDRIEGTVSAEDGPLFDNELRMRVMKLQRSHGLAADGLAGPDTLHYLHVIYGTPLVPIANSSQPRS